MIAEIIKNVDIFLISELKIDSTFPNMQFKINRNDLMQICNLTVLIKEPTCYQSQNPNCIDHFLTNQKTLFKHCQTFEIDLSNHLKLISTIMKSGFFKVPPKKVWQRMFQKWFKGRIGNLKR